MNGFGRQHGQASEIDVKVAPVKMKKFCRRCPIMCIRRVRSSADSSANFLDNVDVIVKIKHFFSSALHDFSASPFSTHVTYLLNDF